MDFFSVASSKPHLHLTGRHTAPLAPRKAAEAGPSAGLSLSTHRGRGVGAVAQPLWASVSFHQPPPPGSPPTELPPHPGWSPPGARHHLWAHFTVRARHPVLGSTSESVLLHCRPPSGCFPTSHLAQTPPGQGRGCRRDLGHCVWQGIPAPPAPPLGPAPEDPPGASCSNTRFRAAALRSPSFQSG